MNDDHLTQHKTTDRAKRLINGREALCWLLISGLCFRSLIAYWLPPGFDEAYYFLYTRHLDWSYFDHPVAVALSTGFGIWLTGLVSPFTIRLSALGLFTASLWILYETGRWLFGDHAGWWSCLIASLSPLFLLTFGTLTAPDNTLIFFWSSALYLSAREFFPNQRPQQKPSPYTPTRKLTAIGVILGLCCLSKYHGFVLGLSLACFCLSSQEHRVALMSKWLGLSITFFGFCLLPILYWNTQNDWISFQFQLSARFQKSSAGYSFLQCLVVFATGVGFLFPTLGLPLWWVSLKAFWKQLARKTNQADAQKTFTPPPSRRVQFILWCGLPIAAGFTLLGGLTHTYPAWPAPGLWTLTLLLGRAAAQWPRKAVHRWLKSTGLIVGTLLIFALLHINLGLLQKPGQYAILGGIISPQEDPSTALIDARQLRVQFETSEVFQDAITDTDFVLTHEFWLSGYVAMALPHQKDNPNKPVVSSFTQDPRGHAVWFDPQQWLGKSALFISIADFSQPEIVSEIEPYFQSVTPLTTLTTKRGRAITETFYIYQADTLIQRYPFPY
ncbi:MAG: glycosyltransferase family 39 protein [Cyanobacteria bacterium P01_F01_bin.53]